MNNIVASEIVCIKNNLTNVNIECFTPKEVETVCMSLNLNKACGADGIYAEHLKFTGSSTFLVLSRLFSVMMINAYRPESLKRGIIVPIPKCNTNQNDPSNYRGITLMCTIGKVFDNLLLKRYECWIFSQLNDLQGISQKTASSLNTTFFTKRSYWTAGCFLCRIV